ncbi:hypothetical protein A3Q56_08730 [Intoshia linei]|uniref:Uncharacterized protein n=1 Tax=Intoshia linei TaxID=1819745 RepID=A0A177AQ79_9BILA|nr:hypothetical protein A3Q56_08730 [Intoshia linei]
MKEDYLLSVKKAIVDFVLRDPRENSESMIKETHLKHRMKLSVVPKPWCNSYVDATISV